jgi:hypothetical protein
MMILKKIKSTIRIFHVCQKICWQTTRAKDLDTIDKKSVAIPARQIRRASNPCSENLNVLKEKCPRNGALY